jgi:hypothetical protein
MALAAAAAVLGIAAVVSLFLLNQTASAGIQ